MVPATHYKNQIMLIRVQQNFVTEGVVYAFPVDYLRRALKCSNHNMYYMLTSLSLATSPLLHCTCVGLQICVMPNVRMDSNYRMGARYAKGKSKLHVNI